MENYIKLLVCVDNAAFGETCSEQAEELAQILFSLARDIRANPEILISASNNEFLKNIRDSNGNTVGRLSTCQS
jgi:thymidine phosphorylase